MINLRSVDLNLLPIFEAVYEERNMTRAADRLAMTQPAVSNAVSRLRAALRDELFVAGRRGTAVTPLADAVYPRVKVALDGVREALGATREFTPRTSDRRFTAGLLYAPGATLGKALADWMRREAPKLGWRFAQVADRDEALAALREGRLDFLLDYAVPTTNDLRSTLLFNDELVVVAAAAHPRLGKVLTRKEFLAERHVAHRSLRTPGSVVQIEGALGDRTLDVAVEVREAIELPLTVAGTEYIAVCNRRLAEPWVKVLGLRLLPLPFRAPPVRGYLVWHASRQRDAGHKWVREGIVRLATGREVAAKDGV
jgi:LysR family transcriptional activator for leuABCD operon